MWRNLLTKNLNEATVVVLGLPYDGAVSCGKGASLAPKVMRELSSYLPPVSYTGNILKTKIYDFGDVEDFNNADSLIGKVTSENKFKLFLGGDHSVSIKTQKAFIEKHQGQKIGIIHIDAHADLCDVYDNNKASHACVNRRAVEHGLNDEDITYIAIRSWEVEELEYYQNHEEVLQLPMYRIKALGLAKVIEIVINKYHNYDNVYLSVDIDNLDPSYAPGTGTPEPGGLSSYELMELVKALVMKLNINTMDVVEVAPPLDVNNITSWAALKLIYEVFSCLDHRRI